LGFCLAELGAFTEGLAVAEEGLRISETVDHPFSVAEACRGVSWLYLRQGNVHQAIPVLERAVGLCQEAPIPLFAPWVTAALGMAYALAGRGAAGLPLVERGVEQAVASGRRGWLVVVLSWLSEAYLLAGRLADELGMRPLQAHCHRGLRNLVRDDRPAQASAHRIVYRH
jgi:tetratricopeptide (TPR) repeat protein